MRSFPGREHRYDVAVVGAGIAGSETALAAARAGLDVLLVTTSLDSVYMLAHTRYRLEPPSGTFMHELQQQLAPERGEVDRWELHREAKYRIESTAGIHLLQSSVTELITAALPGTPEASGAAGALRVEGVQTWEGVARRARVTALCVGSFLRARLQQGRLREVAGRLGEMSYDDLYGNLESNGFEFEPETLELTDGEEPSYSVECRVFATAERGGSDYRLPRLERLFAAGVCLRGEQNYEQAATDGQRLGSLLAGLVRAEPD